MKIRYTYHALQRMAQRNIAKRDIQEALRRGQKHFTEYGMVKCFHHALKGDLVVIYNVRGVAEFEIITTYWT